MNTEMRSMKNKYLVILVLDLNSSDLDHRIHITIIRKEEQSTALHRQAK